jgi:hypothetical protein
MGMVKIGLEKLWMVYRSNLGQLSSTFVATISPAAIENAL